MNEAELIKKECETMTLFSSLSCQRIAARPLVAAVALALAGCSGGGDTAAAGDPLPKVAAPAGSSWSQTVTATDDAFVMGNPDAPLKLVEFASFTCNHCAEFSVTSHEELKRDFIDTGRVSFEIRPFVRDPVDLSLATVATCLGAERYFPLTENIFASQAQLIAAAQAGAQANEERLASIQSLPEEQRLPAMAGIFGIPEFFAARGIPAAETSRCLADSAAVQKRTEVTSRNQRQYEISGTPTFLLNGQVMANAGTWEQVRDALLAAGAR